MIKNPSGKMHLADYSISNKLLTLVDAVISPLSTMLIESLLKGKPCLAFFPETGQNEPTRVENLHFAEFIALKETNSCFKADQFIPTCQKLLSQIGNEELSRKLKKNSEFFVSRKDKTYGHQLAELVKKWLKIRKY